MPDSSATTACPKCGRALSHDAPRGLCSKCLFTAMLAGGPLDRPPASVIPKAALPRIFGSYELMDEVARGGMGIVYKARQIQLNRVVALKVIAAGQFASPDFIERFRTEAETVASLNHPNIVPIYEVGECEGEPFFSMRFVEGGTLASSQRREFSPRQAAELLVKLARAVHYAHQHGILHRDIKPGNILLDAQGEPHLTDFGLAKLVAKESALTRTVAMLGTPSYMAPEQARGEAKQLTTAVDVYGLGAVLYELLTGQPPFAGGTTMETVRQVLEKEPRRPKAIRAGIDRDLETICLKCLAKEPSRRYGSAEALAFDLQRWLRNEPILARPVAGLERIAKLVRRRPLAAALLGITLFAITASVVTLIRANVHIRAARKEALAQRDLAQQRLYESLVREARAIRTIRPLGFRRLVIEKIRQARAIPNAKQDFDVLRSELAQCLGDAMSFDPVTLADPPSSYHDAALNDDGTLVAFGTADGQLSLYDTSSGKVLARFQTKGQLAQVKFGPDGRSLFARALSADDQVSLIEWRRAGNGMWSQQGERSMASLRRLIATNDGVLAALEDSSREQIILTDIETDRVIGSVQLDAGEPFPRAFDVCFGKRLVAVVSKTEGAIHIWDLKANAMRARLSAGLGTIHYLRFSPDEKFLSCVAENGVAAFETAQFKPANTFQQFMASEAPWCGGAATLAVPLSQENGVQLFSVTSGAEATRLTTPHQVREVRCSKDGLTLLVIPMVGPMLVIHQGGDRERSRLVGHVGGVTSIEFSADGARIASTGKDGSIRIWDSQDAKLVLAWERAANGLPGQTVAFSPDNRWLAFGNYENDQVLVYSVADERRVLTLGSNGAGGGGTWTCAFSPDGKVLAAAGDGVRGWEIALKSADGEELQLQARELFKEPGDCRNLAFHPSGSSVGYQLISRGKGNEGSYIRGLTHEDAAQFIDGDPFTVQTLGFTGDGSALVHMNKNQALVFSNIDSRQTIRTFSTSIHSESVSTYVDNFRVSPDGTRVAAANHNGRGVNVIDVASGRRLYSLPDDAGSIWWIAWHPNGRHLAVSRGNGDISLWNLAEVEAALASVGLAP